MRPVRLDERGRISIQGHLPEECALRAIAQEVKCRCDETMALVIAALKGGAVSKVPSAFQEAVDARRGRLSSRKRLRSCGSDPLDTPWSSRASKRVREIALDIAQGVLRGHVEVRIGDAACERSVEKEWHNNRITTSVRVPLHWYARVYRQGIAEVDGRGGKSWLVLDAGRPEPDGSRWALAARNTRGHHTEVCRGRIRQYKGAGRFMVGG
jgi:hypothetical protein